MPEETGRNPYSYGFKKTAKCGLMPVRIDHGNSWRLSYGPTSPPATHKKAGLANAALGSTNDLFQSMDSLFQPKNISISAETRSGALLTKL